MNKTIVSSLISFVLCFFSACMTDYDAEIDRLIRGGRYDEAYEVAYQHFSDNSMYGYQTRQINKIAIAHYRELFRDNDFRAIKEMRKERLSDYAYQKVFAENINRLLNQQKTDLILSSLHDWEIFYRLNLEVEQWPKNIMAFMQEGTVYDADFDITVADAWKHKTEQPGRYNTEIKFYNSLLNTVLDRLIEEHDHAAIKDLISLYKPCAIMKSHSDVPGEEHNKELGGKKQLYLFHLSDNTDKEAAIKQLHSHGITL